MAREVTSITVAEDGTESHESWLVLQLSKVSATPGMRLFDSEITHSRYVQVTVCRCIRKRDLNRDWKHATRVLMEFAMSQAQWGAFVSAFGDGSGAPATLTFDQSGDVAQAPYESRMAEGAREVRDAGSKALAEVRDDYQALAAAFERGAGKREMRGLINTLGYRIGNGPANMEFAATSLTEHVENVVTKARADVEAMVLAAADNAGLTLDATSVNLLGAGES